MNEAVAPSTAGAAPRFRVRWRIFSLLFGFGLFAYVQQRCITVASYQMMPALHISQLELSYLEEALLLGYTVLQFPGGLLGLRLGARSALTWISVVALAAMLLTPLAPLLAGGTLLFGLLLTLQLVIGGAQAPIFPVCAGVFESWFPPHQWPLVQGVQSMGLQLGAAMTPPLIAGLMTLFGWQSALVWANLPVLAVIVIWARYARNTPAEHPAITAAELEELAAERRAAGAGAEAAPASGGEGLRALLASRDIILLTISYLCLNYCFYLLANWVFLYLVQERHFALLEGGWLAGLPPLAAAFGSGLGGLLTSRLLHSHGARWGLHRLPMLTMPAAGLLIFLAVQAANPYLAVAALTLAYGCVEANEGSYWAAAMYIGRADAMAAGGILNTGGNAGGLIATPLVGYLSGHHQWTTAFVTGTVLACVSAGAWLFIDPTRPPGRARAKMT